MVITSILIKTLLFNNSLLSLAVVNDEYHPRVANRRCNMVQKFNFSLEELSLSFDDITLSKSVLRAYLQPIERLLSTHEKVDIEVNISARALSNDSDCGGVNFVSSQIISVSKDTNDDWAEWDITNGIKSCWDSIENITHIELIINFHRVNCMPGKKKIPLEIADPAIVPLDEIVRRSRYWPLQPFVLIYIDDEEERNLVRSSLQTAEPDEFVIDEFDNTENAIVQKRDTMPPCRLKPLSIYFADIGMYHILVPNDYNANQCSASGDCSKRSIGNNEVNNHSILLATARKWYVDSKANTTTGAVPEDPRCVSVTHGVLLLFVLNRDLTVVGRYYPNMIATRCGCRA